MDDNRLNSNSEELFSNPAIGDNLSNDEILDPDTLVSWQASEYVHHKKDILWYAIFFLISIGLALGLFLILKDYSILVLVAVMSAAIFIYANRTPSTLDYEVSNLGLFIGERGYLFDDFSSFSIAEFKGLYSIELSPLQRFKPAVSIMFAPTDGEKIINVLSTYLPHEDHEIDLVDRFIRYLRF